MFIFLKNCDTHYETIAKTNSSKLAEIIYNEIEFWEDNENIICVIEENGKIELDSFFNDSYKTFNTNLKIC